MMWRISITIILSCLVEVLYGQAVYEEILRNPLLSANNYCIYPDREDRQYTEAPQGKLPFYISHYGRHGSRYLTSERAYEIPIDILSKGDSLNKLTPLGETVLREMRIAYEDAKGHFGDLTALGYQQHRHIIRRMMEHFPAVFEGAAHVDARSTTRRRCILSMGAALQQMVAINPELQITMDASQHDMWYMNHQDRMLRDSMLTDAAVKGLKAYTDQREHYERLMGSLFNDTVYVRQQVDDKNLCYYLYKVATILQNTHLADNLHLMDIFTVEELYRLWQMENVWWYITHGPSLLNGGYEPYTQRKVLRKIIEETDSCILLEKPGVTLRYGHDTIVLPLTCLLNLNGYGFQTMDLEEVESHGWVSYRIFPMACNLQFIFYRTNPQDQDVLFKVLLNEEEATLPLDTSMAPYYRWSDFREYYLKRLDAYERQRD